MVTVATAARERGRAAALLVGVLAAVGLAALAGPTGRALAASTAAGNTTPPASNPFTPGIPTPTASTPVQSTPNVQTLNTTSTSSDSGFSGSGIVAIAIGALLILGGISFFIWHDARKRAPVRARTVPTGAGLPGTGKPGSKRAPKPRKHSRAERRRRKRGRAR